MSESIEKIELDIWNTKIKEAKESLRLAEKYAKNDPLMTILDCNIEFKKLLDENKGSDRTTKSFSDKVSVLSKREKKAIKLAKTFNLIDALDKVNEAKFYLAKVSEKYYSVKFRFRNISTKPASEK